MSDWNPTTEDIRNDFARDGMKYADMFDRWLAEVKAQAWDEGFDAGERDVFEHELTHWDDSDCIQNPYRKENK